MFTISKEVDTCNMNPQQPLLRTLFAMNTLKAGQVLKLTTREHGAIARMEKFCRQTGLTLMQYMDWDGEFTFFIRKGGGRVTG